MSIAKLGTLTKTQATYNSETGEELTPATYYIDPTTGEPWYHVDTTYPLDVPDTHKVTPEPNHKHKFAGVQTYHYRFTSEAQFYELVPEAAPVEEEPLDA